MKTLRKLILMIFVMMFSLCPVKAQEHGTVTVSFTGGFEGEISITSLNEGPLPAEGELVKVQGITTLHFSFPVAGTYDYEIKQIPGDEPHVHYDDTIWHLQATVIYVGDKLESYLVVYRNNGEDKPDGITFKNTVEIPTTCKVIYVTTPDEKYWFPPSGNNVPEERNYPFNSEVTVEKGLGSKDDYVIIDGKKIYGHWEFSGWDITENFIILQDTVITGSWKFIPSEDQPETGDQSPIGLYAALLVISLTTGAYALKKQKESL